MVITWGKVIEAFDLFSVLVDEMQTLIIYTYLNHTRYESKNLLKVENSIPQEKNK